MQSLSPQEPGPVNVPTRIVLARPITWLAAMIVLLWTGSSIAQDGAATLRATTLDGVDVTVPDLQRAAVLVIGFGRAAGEQVRPWRTHIDGIESGPPVASVMVIDGVPGLLRGLLTRTMRGEVAEERQPTIYLVTEDGDAWRELVRFDETDGADAAYVLRFDAQGQVCFRHVGAITDVAATGLLAANCDSGASGGGAEQSAD